MKVFSWPKIDKSCCNYHMIPIHSKAVSVLLSEAKRMAKKSQIILPFWPCYALVGKIDTISLTCECSCILCPNVENFCPNNSQFFSIGDATASPASHAIRLWWQVCDTSKLNCEWFADPNFFS